MMRKPTETQCLELALAQAKECETEISDLQEMLLRRSDELDQKNRELKTLRNTLNAHQRDQPEPEAQCSHQPMSKQWDTPVAQYPSFERWMKEQPMADPNWSDYVRAMAHRGITIE